jgi:hypothetical protein
LSEEATEFAADGVEETLFLRTVVKKRATLLVDHVTEKVLSCLLSEMGRSVGHK